MGVAGRMAFIASSEMATEANFKEFCCFCFCFCFFREIWTVKSSSSLEAGSAGAETESATSVGTASVGSLLTLVPPCEQ